MRLPSLIESLARFLAILGGMAFLAIAILTTASVTGRSLISLGLGPIPGDFELVELLMAFGVFAVLPWCHLKGQNVSVDILTRRLGQRINRLIDITANGLMLAAALLIAWRLGAGLADKYANGETTFILQFPVWIGYAAALAGAAGLALIALYCFLRSWAAIVGPHRKSEAAERSRG